MIIEICDYFEDEDIDINKPLKDCIANVLKRKDINDYTDQRQFNDEVLLMAEDMGLTPDLSVDLGLINEVFNEIQSRVINIVNNDSEQMMDFEVREVYSERYKENCLGFAFSLDINVEEIFERKINKLDEEEKERVNAKRKEYNQEWFYSLIGENFENLGVEDYKGERTLYDPYTDNDYRHCYRLYDEFSKVDGVKVRDIITLTAEGDTFEMERRTEKENEYNITFCNIYLTKEEKVALLAHIKMKDEHIFGMLRDDMFLMSSFRSELSPYKDFCVKIDEYIKNHKPTDDDRSDGNKQVKNNMEEIKDTSKKKGGYER